MHTQPVSNCSICGSSDVSFRGTLSVYLDYEAPLYDCNDCKCRFSPRDESIYEHLHASETSSYAGHVRYAQELASLFTQGSLSELGQHLSRFDKNKLVIDSINQLDEHSNILELGCSCGYLTSYAIKAGHRILGVDISNSAVERANALFGEHFAVTESRALSDRAPYDLIYHVGTIGCVDTPLEFTQTYFDMLKPGGQLVFNCPNLRHCKELDLDWMTSCSPPDLVCLFQPNVWESRFRANAEVTIQEIDRPMAVHDLAKAVGRLLPKDYLFKNSTLHWRSKLRRLYYRYAFKMSRLSEFLGKRRFPTEYGLHVVLRRLS